MLVTKGLFPRGLKRCHCVGMGYSLPNNKILNIIKLYAFADDKCNGLHSMMSYDVGKHGDERRKCFFSFPTCFLKPYFLGRSQSGSCDKRLKLSPINTHFNTLKKTALGKHFGKKVKLFNMSNFTFFHNVFYASVS